MAAEPG